MGNNVIYSKIEIIERCLKRIKEVYDNNNENLKDYTKQDSIILNIHRICEACIDLAMHIVFEKKLGIPQNSRYVFEVLCSDDIININLMNKLKDMVVFRDIALHNYKANDLKIVQHIIQKQLVDVSEFSRIILIKYENSISSSTVKVN